MHPFSVTPCSDIASLNHNGYCRIEGRIKDMINRGGEKIFPAEVEQFLYRHPKVKDVQVGRAMALVHHKEAAVQELQRQYRELSGTISFCMKPAGGWCKR